MSQNEKEPVIPSQIYWQLLEAKMVSNPGEKPLANGAEGEGFSREQILRQRDNAARIEKTNAERARTQR